jgi:hypothetical protein
MFSSVGVRIPSLESEVSCISSVTSRVVLLIVSSPVYVSASSSHLRASFSNGLSSTLAFYVTTSMAFVVMWFLGLAK